MLILQLTGRATFSLLSLPGWERERISDALILLTTDPRPPTARALTHLDGEAFEIWVGSERRLHYRIYKNDSDEDSVVMVFRVI